MANETSSSEKYVVLTSELPLLSLAYLQELKNTKLGCLGYNNPRLLAPDLVASAQGACAMAGSGTMAMYYFLRVSLFLGIFGMASLVRCVHQAKNESLGPRVPVHGNWCGPSHGGFQDCCYGGPCPSCVAPELGQLDYRFSQECFNECPPIDWVDLACAWHDTCTYVAGEVNGCGHFLDAESCYCNCVLADIACRYIADGVCTYFRDIASCWFCDNDAYYPIGCDEIGGDADWPVSYFCTDAVSTVKAFLNYGEMVWQGTSCWSYSGMFGQEGRELRATRPALTSSKS
ncbi:Disintegrin domain-containing protein [Balamuthia mandrillaris]